MKNLKKILKLKSEEKKCLLTMARKGIEEYKEGKTKTLKRGQRLLDLLES